MWLLYTKYNPEVMKKTRVFGSLRGTRYVFTSQKIADVSRREERRNIKAGKKKEEKNVVEGEVVEEEVVD